MSPEDVERIRTLYDAMNRRDLEALRDFAGATPDFEWQSAPDEPDASTRRGGSRAFAHSRDLLETFEQLETEIEEVIDLGPDAAIFVVNHRIRGAASGAEAERAEAHLWTRRDGHIAGLREFASLEDALAAARGEP